MILAGLTGSIGSGKSTVSLIVKKHSRIGVVDADEIAHKVLLPGTPAYYGIVETFGPGVLVADDRQQGVLRRKPPIDRKELARLVFTEKPECVNILNKLTHRWIILECVIGILWYFVLGKSCCILDAPLLIEGNLHKYVSKVIVVIATRDTIVERLTKRSPNDDSLIKRLNFQMPQEKKVTFADYTIDNNGTLKELEDEVRQLIALIQSSCIPNISILLVGILPALMLMVALISLKYLLFLYYFVTRINKPVK